MFVFLFLQLFCFQPSLYRIKQILRSGIPDAYPGLRSICWKIVLGALPVNPAEWDNALENNLKLYNTYRDELVIEIEKVKIIIGNTIKSYCRDKPPADPLGGPSKASPFNSSGVITNYSLILNHREELLHSMLEQIDKDVFRTRPELGFFFLPLSPEHSAANGSSWESVEEHLCVLTNLEESATIEKRYRSGLKNQDGSFGNVRPSPSDGSQETDIKTPRIHYDLLGRLLFVFAALNPGIQYVQGMNELIAPIFFSTFTDPLLGLGANLPSATENSNSHAFESELATLWESNRSAALAQAEADTFIMFCCVMQEQRDLFCKALDTSTSGVKGKLEEFYKTLCRCDIELGSHLQRIGIDPMFFGLRWLMLWFSQEFELPDVIRLWDFIIPDCTGVNYLTEMKFTPAVGGVLSDESSSNLDMRIDQVNEGMNRDNISDEMLGVPHRVSYIAVAMVIALRDTLIQADFGSCMKLLQRFPPIDVASLLPHADLLRAEDRSRLLQAYLPSPSSGLKKMGLTMGAIGNTLKRLRDAGHEKALSVAQAISDRQSQRQLLKHNMITAAVVTSENENSNNTLTNVEDSIPSPHSRFLFNNNKNKLLNDNSEISLSPSKFYEQHESIKSSQLLQDPLGTALEARQKRHASDRLQKGQVQPTSSVGDDSWFDREMGLNPTSTASSRGGFNNNDRNGQISTSNKNSTQQIDQNNVEVAGNAQQSNPLFDVMRIMQQSTTSTPSNNSSNTMGRQVWNAAKEGVENETVQTAFKSAAANVSNVANNIANWFGGSANSFGSQSQSVSGVSSTNRGNNL